MELSLPHTLHLFNIFREYDGKENCAKVLEEECIKMFGTKSLDDEHDCNVVSMNSLNIHSTNDDCTSHDENISHKHVNFCGVHVCMNTPNREDVYCKRHKHLETKLLQQKLNGGAENLHFLCRTGELCNEHGHLHLLWKLFHDRIVSKNCDDFISLSHYNELTWLLSYEELKHLIKNLPEFAHKKFLDIDLEDIYMFCAVNCIENPYIANYLKKRKQIEDEENTN